MSVEDASALDEELGNAERSPGQPYSQVNFPLKDPLLL